MKPILAVVCGLLLFAATGQSQAATIDFEDLGITPGTQFNPPDNAVITSGGFDFTNGPGSSIPDLHFPNGSALSISGTTELISHEEGIMTVSGGGTFTLNQFDWGGVLSESGTFTVIGNLSGGGSVSQVFALDGNTATLETFVLPGTFTNLASVTFEHLGGSQGSQNIDNIVVNQQSTPVPEPSALALCGLGVLGLAGYRLRRRKKFA
jgi:hypothetical protein